MTIAVILMHVFTLIFMVVMSCITWETLIRVDRLVEVSKQDLFNREFILGDINEKIQP